MNQTALKGASSFVLLLFLQASLQAQITVSGVCITNPVTTNSVAAVESKPAFEGTGTVQGTANVAVSIFWIGAPDNVWVLAYDGQPYFYSTCNVAEPPGTGNASCPWLPVSGMTCTGGTALSITGAGVLPVRLLHFSAEKRSNSVALRWKTGSESNNKGFTIQHSTDGMNWRSLGFVPGAGNSSSERDYQFTDHTPVNGKNYYRLAQTDLNGQITYSLVIPVDFSSTVFYTLANNPGRGQYQLTNHAAEPVAITVTDEKGRVVLQKMAQPGVRSLDLTNQPAGLYLLRLVKGQTSVTEKLIKL